MKANILGKADGKAGELTHGILGSSLAVAISALVLFVVDSSCAASFLSSAQWLLRPCDSTESLKENRLTKRHSLSVVSQQNRLESLRWVDRLCLEVPNSG